MSAATPRRWPRTRESAGPSWGRFLALIAILGALGGCGLTPQGDAIRAAVATKGAEVYDEGLANAIWVKCKASSVGSIERRYMQTKETWAIWTDECLTNGARELPGRDPMASEPFVPSPLGPVLR